MTETLHKIEIEGNTMAALAVNPEKEGIPVVFLHGITASVYSWGLEKIPCFDEYPWYSISLPGHTPGAFGASFRPEQLNTPWIARQVVQTIRALIGEREYILIGHSTGGFAALAIAALYPQNLRAVCSLAGFVRGRWLGYLAHLQWLSRGGVLGRTLFAQEFAVIKGLVRLEAVLKPLPAQASPERRRWTGLNKDCFLTLNRRHICTWFDRIQDIDISEQIAAINVPLMVMYGDHDLAVPPDESRYVMQRVAGCEAVELPGVGHFVTTQRVDLYEKAMTGWLRRVTPNGRG